MRSKRQQQQSTRRIRRERRRLGRFVAFSEMLADLTPKPLMAKPLHGARTRTGDATRSQPPDRAAVRLAAARGRANLTQTEAAERLEQTFVSEIRHE
jgi:hypothetical protein